MKFFYILIKLLQVTDFSFPHYSISSNLCLFFLLIKKIGNNLHSYVTRGRIKNENKNLICALKWDEIFCLKYFGGSESLYFQRKINHISLFMFCFHLAPFRGLTECAAIFMCYFLVYNLRFP